MCSSFKPVCSSSSTGVSSSVCSSPPLADPKQTALEQCIARVKLAVQQVRLCVHDESLSEFNCPITNAPAKDPVVAVCGHLFDRAVIEQWKEVNDSCPVCRTSPMQLNPILALRDHIAKLLAKDPIPTCSNFKSRDQQRAARFIEMAHGFIDENDYREALDLYSKAFRYTNASADYAAIPKLYDQLQEPKKANLSRLYLSLYQLQEGKVEEAIKTLESCKSDVFNISSLILALKLHLSPSLENIEWAMKEASECTPDDTIFIYKQILRLAPERLDLYQLLIPLIKDPEERKELLLQAADFVDKAKQSELAQAYRKAAEKPLISNVITKEEWAAANTIPLPPYPQELQDFLAGDCTIWPGKKRLETHIVVPLFPQVVINGVPTPLTLDSLNHLDRSSGGPGYQYLWDPIPKNIPAENEFHYAVMTNDVIPGSRNKSYDAQLQLLPAGYEVPGVFDAARAILWENRRSGKRCFIDYPSTFTRCREIVQGCGLIVGRFGPSGLGVGCMYADYETTGVAGWRKFRL